jgi:hypothetical protein
VAAQHGHWRVVRYLTECGANVNLSNGIALRHAVNKGNLEMVEFLVTCGANVNMENPLKIAIHRFPVIEKYLRDHGATEQ